MTRQQRFERTKFSQRGKRAEPGKGMTLYYCGDGKGKTTAAVGLAVRARGAALRVCFIQFLKSLTWPSHERGILKDIGVTVRVHGKGFVGMLGDAMPRSAHRQAAAKALRDVRSSMRSGRFDVVIADEAVSAVDEGLVAVRDIVALIKQRPPAVHLVITGHTRYPSIVAVSDLVTEMRKVKHPFTSQHRLAERGIDY